MIKRVRVNCSQDNLGCVYTGNYGNLGKAFLLLHMFRDNILEEKGMMHGRASNALLWCQKDF